MTGAFPPYRFAYVEETLLRGAYPRPRNEPFLQTLGLKTVLSLTPEPLPVGTLGAVALAHIKVDKPKDDGIPLSFPKVFQILGLLLDPENHPLYVHCLDGTVVTSLVVMCLRKLQGWAPSAYRSEAARFLRDGLLSPEETEFMDKFTGDFEVPLVLPKWLWGGAIQGWKRHPFFKLKFSASNGWVNSCAGNGSSGNASGNRGVITASPQLGDAADLSHRPSLSTEYMASSQGTPQMLSLSTSTHSPRPPIHPQSSASRPQSATTSTTLSLATLKLQQEKEELRRMALLDDVGSLSPPILHSVMGRDSPVGSILASRDPSSASPSAYHHTHPASTSSGLGFSQHAHFNPLLGNELHHSESSLLASRDGGTGDEGGTFGSGEEDDMEARPESRTLEALDLEVMTSGYTLGN